VIRHSTFSVAAVVAAFGLASTPLAGAAQGRQQSGDTASVPRALAEALMDPFGMLTMMGGQPRLVVAALPAKLAKRLWVPPGSKVLGGLESEPVGVAVIRSSLSQESLIAGYRREQLKLGWNAPPERSLMTTMGFQPAPGSQSPDTPDVTVCSAATSLGISVRSVGPGLSEIRATAVDDMGGGRCTPARADGGPGGHFPNHPTLVNPPGSSDTDIKCSFWNSSAGMGGPDLRTTMTLESILAHYGKQLTDSGWVQTSGQTIGRSWVRKDSTGTWQINLSVRADSGASGCVDVGMEVRGRRP